MKSWVRHWWSDKNCAAVQVEGFRREDDGKQPVTNIGVISANPWRSSKSEP